MSREEKIEIAVKRIFRSEGVPPFAQNAQEAILQALDPDGSAAQLTRVIHKDLGLTSQILRSANSSLYNRSGKPILSVPHSIALLGWETIRNLVSAMRYVEHFASGSPGLRELMLQSLLTATHGRQLAATVGYPRPEEAYVCSLFRNLGEVLMARYQPREYSEIIVQMQRDKIPERSACLRVLDFTWDDVALRLAEAWNLPAQVSTCLGPEEAAEGVLDRCLQSVTGYGKSLTTALYRSSGRLDSIHLNTILDAQGRAQLVCLRDLRRIIDCALENTSQTFAALRIPVSTLTLERQAAAARVLLETPPSAESCEIETEGAPDEGAIFATHSELDGQTRDVSAIVLDALRELQGNVFSRAIFALLTKQRDAVCGRLGAGNDVDTLVEQFRFPMDRPDAPVAAAMLRRQNLVVNCAVDGRYDRSELVRAFRPRVFALCPVVVDDVVAGCIYADNSEAPVCLPEGLRDDVDRARGRIAGALARVRSESLRPMRI